MSPVERAYQKFKHRNDNTKVIDGKIYYRIVWSDYINITGKDGGLLSVVPSPDMPKKVGIIYQDENGNHFSFGEIHHIRFEGEIPEWYFECGECTMEWQETKNIGEFLTIIE